MNTARPKRPEKTARATRRALCREPFPLSLHFRLIQQRPGGVVDVNAGKIRTRVSDSALQMFLLLTATVSLVLLQRAKRPEEASQNQRDRRAT